MLDLRSPWVVAAVAVMWVALAAHTAMSMRARGRRFWVWLVISVFLTIIPATVVSYVDYYRHLRRRGQAPGGGRRCRHCGAFLGGRDIPQAGGQRLCPDCRLPLDDQTYA